MKQNRLFLPLNSDPYDWFISGDKTWELRKRKGNFTEKTVYIGRSVEIRKGYGLNHPILWGTIQEIVIDCSYKNIFNRVPFNLIIPHATSLEEAIISAESIMGTCQHTEELICFKIELK